MDSLEASRTQISKSWYECSRFGEKESSITHFNKFVPVGFGKIPIGKELGFLKVYSVNCCVDYRVIAAKEIICYRGGAI